MLKVNKSITVDFAIAKRIEDERIKLSPLINKLLKDYFFEVDKTVYEYEQQRQEQEQ